MGQISTAVSYNDPTTPVFGEVTTPGCLKQQLTLMSRQTNEPVIHEPRGYMVGVMRQHLHQLIHELITAVGHTTCAIEVNFLDQNMNWKRIACNKITRSFLLQCCEFHKRVLACVPGLSIDFFLGDAGALLRLEANKVLMLSGAPSTYESVIRRNKIPFVSKIEETRGRVPNDSIIEALKTDEAATQAFIQTVEANTS